jgi:hypothetical protein
MPLDCHLFVDLQEGAAKNVALTYHIKENDEDLSLKYSFATPVKVFNSLHQTITEGCPSPKCIAEEIMRVFKETLGRVVEAQGCYIEDSSKQIVRSGMQAEAEIERKRRETIPVDAFLVMIGFKNMLENDKWRWS